MRSVSFWRTFGSVALLGFSALVGCQQAPRAPHRGPPISRQSSKADRKSVAVTIYNQNFGVVRDTRRLRLGAGRVELAFKDVSGSIQPETVRLHSLTRGAAFEVLEQNYRYDLLTPAKLLEKNVGKRIAVYRYNERTGTEEKKQAEVLSVEGGVTLRIDGEVTTNFQGRYAFPDVPANLLEKPTLVWLLDSNRAEQDVEVTYLTHGLNWRADSAAQPAIQEGRRCHAALRADGAGSWSHQGYLSDSGSLLLSGSERHAVKKDAGAFTFNIKVPKRGKTKVTYRVRLRYC